MFAVFSILLRLGWGVANLDPADWNRFRLLAHRMVDDMLDGLEHLRDTPVWQKPPNATVEAIRREPVPFAGQGEERAYDDFLKHVAPYTNGNRHPRFFGWVHGNGTPLGMMADMLASGINPHLAGYDQSPRYVEQQVVEWLAELMGFPATASGVFASGGSMANVLGLAVARHAKAGFDVRAEGIQGMHKPLVVYCSTEVHGWARKAVELLGMGDRYLRRVPVDERYRIRLDLLEAAIQSDIAAGLHPICVIGSAGTVNTGATDDLSAIRDICRRHDLWFHVDGAFGALVRLCKSLRPLVAGMEHADSIAFDLHKWMSMPFECAVTLVRDPEAHRATFAMSPSYLAALSRGPVAGGFPLADLGMDLSRSFKALKAWMSLKAQGVDLFAQVIEQNVLDTAEFARKIAAHPELELLAPVEMNIACFRFVGNGIPDVGLNHLNKELLIRLQESGVALPSSTVLNGRFAIRVANVNHRTLPEDFDLMIETVVRLGRELADTSPLTAGV